ncbi:DUF4293 family protein [Blattabacterium cuenoti]|uniref:DUF4293 family protein n=1 Tax=Blattabacterium cuenoti TaxID=1653831 RepID=UPI00163B7D4F|nr:DUF4293 family protein [Blattabacterium cuenoti]
MLYRIQTLYLIISIFIYSIYLYYYYNYNINTFNTFNFISKTIFIFLCLILSILNILFFKKKKLQIFMNKINILLNSINLILLFNQKIFLKKNIYLFFILCICNILVLYICNKKIKKDIELIDSMNRIR